MYENSTLPDIRRKDDEDIDDEIATNELSKDNIIFNQKDSYYTSKDRFYSRPPPVKTKISTTKLNPVYGGNDYYYKNRESNKFDYYFNRKGSNTRMYNQIDQIAKRPFKPWQTKSSWGEKKRYQQYPATRKVIYPIIGKRSVRDLDVSHEDHHEDRLSLHHHRSTRHSLYQSIERYLET